MRGDGDDGSHNPFPSLTERTCLATNYEAAVQKRIVDRYHARRFNGLYGKAEEGFDLPHFKKEMLGGQVADELNKTYRTLLSRLDKITPWCVAHKSDLDDQSTQEVQLLPYRWAVDAQLADTSSNRVFGYGGPLCGAGFRPPVLPQQPVPQNGLVAAEPPVLFRYGGDDNDDNDDLFYHTITGEEQPQFTTSTATRTMRTKRTSWVM